MQSAKESSLMVLTEEKSLSFQILTGFWLGP